VKEDWTMNAQEPLWDIVEVAAYLKVPASSIYKMTGSKAGLRIPHIKLSGRLRFRKRDVDRWLELLSVSNLDVLEKVRKKVGGRLGNYPQEETS
jgi:excisionase family DNA binding protein